jgi:hypothetical protein
VHFPLSSPPRFTLTARGLQPAANFTMKEFAEGVDGDDRTVGAVEIGSAAEAAGLQAGDVIVIADGRPIKRYRDLYNYLYGEWPRGKTELQLAVRRGNDEIELPKYEPWTLGLHPTQLYESVSTFLLFLLVSAYYPFRWREGSVMILLMLGYSVHRFLNEMLRNDTGEVAFGMTLSQNGSILVFVAALVLAWWRWRSPRPEPSAQLRPAPG